MSAKPSTAKEALLAELLGDVQLLLDRVEALDQNAKATAAALNEATAQYRVQVDTMVKSLRGETSSMILKATEHVTQQVGSSQQATLQKAAAAAIHQALSKEILRRTRLDWFATVVIAALVSAAITATSLMLR